MSEVGNKNCQDGKKPKIEDVSSYFFKMKAMCDDNNNHPKIPRNNVRVIEPADNPCKTIPIIAFLHYQYPK